MKVQVHHAPNTGDLTPNDYTDFSSWIEYWKSLKSLELLKSGDFYYCPDCGKRTLKSDFEGAHIQIKGGSNLYIIPTCKTCNDKKETKHLFDIDENLLVPMPNKKK